MIDENAKNRRRRAPIWGAGLTAFTGQGAAAASPQEQGGPFPAQPHGQPGQPYLAQGQTYAPQDQAYAAQPSASAQPALVPAARPNLPPDQALRRLLDGNRRFVTQPDVCSANLSNASRARVADQAPYAVILGCSDSRVAPELIFGGVGPGEIFTARNAGNMADEFTIGTIELGTGYLGASVVMVLTHQRCGAVEAACDVVATNAYYPPSIESVVQPIIPAALAVRQQPGDFATNTLRESARRTARRIVERSTILAELVQLGRLQVVAAEFSLDTGVVTLL